MKFILLPDIAIILTGFKVKTIIKLAVVENGIIAIIKYNIIAKFITIVIIKFKYSQEVIMFCNII